MIFQTRIARTLLLSVGIFTFCVGHVDAGDTGKEPVEAAGEPVVEVYDVHALTTPMFEFPLEASPHAPAFVVPANRQPQGNDGPGGDLYREHPPAHENLGEEVIKVIVDSVGPDSWKENGGTVGSIREARGLLVVRQTPINQKIVASLLKKMTEERYLTVRTSAEWVLLPTSQIGAIVKHAASGTANEASVREVDREALEKLPTGTRRFHADLLSRNGQTVHFISGREQTVTVSQSATVATNVSAYTPEVGNVGGGIALQINPAVDRDQKMAVVTLFSTFNDPEKPGKIIPIRSVATTQSSTGNPLVAAEASATYRSVSGIVQELRTTVRLPLGVPVLVGAMTLEPVPKEAGEQQLLLILTIHAD